MTRRFARDISQNIVRRLCIFSSRDREEYYSSPECARKYTYRFPVEFLAVRFVPDYTAITLLCNRMLRGNRTQYKHKAERCTCIDICQWLVG